MGGSVSRWPIGVEAGGAGPEAGEGKGAAAAGSLNDAGLRGGEERLPRAERGARGGERASGPGAGFCEGRR